jgi:cytochrome P450
MLWIIFGSANRDEATYPEPDAFEPERSGLDNHVAFGLGAHFCPGAPLSRLEARVALEHLTRRLDLPRFAPDVRFTYLPSFILRGLEELKIEVRKR